MMKKSLMLVLSIFLLFGCTPKKERKELNILNWSSYIPSEVILAFEKETGIKVNYATYSSNEELLAKISNAKVGTYDLIFPSDYMVEILKDRNMLQRLEKTKINNLNNINSTYLNLHYDKGNEYTLPFIAASTVIAVNKNDIQNQIISYNDLLNPEYKNSIVLIDDQRIIIGMALLANGYNMNSIDDNELSKATEWLLKLKPNVKAYDSDSPKNFLISKEASIGIVWNAEAALASLENPNIDIIFPKEGVALSVDNFAIPKDAHHQEESYAFIDYILKPEVMKKIIESYPYKNVNKMADYLLSDEYLNNPASNLPDNIINNGYFVNNVGFAIKKYDRVWIKIK